MSKQVDDRIDAVVALSAKNNEIRRAMAEKLSAAANKLNFDDIDKMRSSELESRLGVFTTVDSILKSMESSEINNVKIMLSKQNTEANVGTAETVANLLRAVKVGDIIPPRHGDATEDDIDNKLDGVISGNAEIRPVSAGELGANEQQDVINLSDKKTDVEE
jgi:hypothetical protein